MHVGIHTFRILGESLEVIQHRFLEIHFINSSYNFKCPAIRVRRGAVTQVIYTMAFTNPQ